MGQLNRKKTVESFEEAKALYDSIKPVGGQLEGLNLRPVYRTGRVFDSRVVKISEDEYTFTTEMGSIWASRWNSTAKWKDNEVIKTRQQQCLSFMSDGSFTIYYPAVGRDILDASHNNHVASCVTSPISVKTYQMLDTLLPVGMSSVRHDGKLYIQIEPKGRFKEFRQYVVPKTLEGLKFKQVRGVWTCLNPVQEFKYRMDMVAVNAWLKENFEAYKSFVYAMPQETLDADRRYWYNMENAQKLLRDNIQNPFESALIIRLMMGKRKRAEDIPEDRIKALIKSALPKAMQMIISTPAPIGKVVTNSRYGDGRDTVTLI
jgi:hypothetical protein